MDYSGTQSHIPEEWSPHMWSVVPDLLLDPRLESAAAPSFSSSSVLVSNLLASILDSPDSSERAVFGLLSKKLK